MANALTTITVNSFDDPNPRATLYTLREFARAWLTAEAKQIADTKREGGLLKEV